ncbi:BnaA01g18140D [Brassica napus]|uniref:BnaA01g18140D protein n=1 Tax=Brassica napus TaxID=3708 RepID=A0A078HWW1_BRANA|nr:BnaA01g18140D [Brassica napus]
MCQLRRSHGILSAVHDVGSSNFHQTAMTGCLAGSATSIWEVIEFRAIYYLTVEEMKRYGAKRGGHTCASLSYDSESSVELRAPRPFHVKVVTLEPTCF